MKPLYKKIFTIGLFDLIFLLVSFTNGNPRIYSIDTYAEIIENNDINIKSSGFWNLTGTPIIIDDTAPFEPGSMNWSEAVLEDWCNGAGTWSNPYTIENVTISANSTTSGIRIVNSTAFFLIKNCTLLEAPSSYTAGIVIESTTNGKLIENYLSNNNMGIFIYYSNNITIRENTCEDNSGSAITVYYSSDNYVEQNIVQQNSGYGIVISHGANNNQIINNYITQNVKTGIEVSYDSDSNYIYKNHIFQNSISGLSLWYLSDSNSIIENNISNNGQYGIHIHPDCSNNIIRGNYLENNEFGCYKDEGENNIFENNICTNPFSDLFIWIIAIGGLAGIGFMVIIVYRKKKIEKRA
jgi:parallel beta-helix repeat protein